MAKTYCFSCRHLNPEGAQFCENCGAKLPARESGSLHPQAGVNKWKVISAVSIAIIVILASGLFYYYSNYNQLSDNFVALSGQYDSLHSSYEQLSNEYSTLQSRYNQLGTNYNNLNNEQTTLKQQYNDLNSKYLVLNDSFNKLLDANNRIRNEINNFQGKIINYAPYDNPQQIIYRYTDDMKNFVLDSVSKSRQLTIAGKTYTSEDYFKQDLYFIHQDWYDIFTYDLSYQNSSPMVTIHYIGATMINHTLPTGQTYLWVASLDIINDSFPTAPLMFEMKRGVCYDFALVQTELYQCYFDLTGAPYSAYELFVANPSKNFYHACVLLKSPYGKVAIIDWVIYSSTGCNVNFRSVYEEIGSQEEYWGSLNYTYVMSRNYYKTFRNNDEFCAWAQGNG